MKKSLTLTGWPGIALYSFASLWNWLTDNLSLIAGIMFLYYAYYESGLFSVLWCGIALILIGINDVRRDVIEIKKQLSKEV